MRKSEGGNTPW